LRRRVRAVEELSLGIRLGEVFGLAGPNGAGKSTLIALMLGFVRPTAGRIRIGGTAPRHYVERFGIGYLSELVNIPPRWELEQALTRYALLAGVPTQRTRARVGEVITLLGLEEHRGKQVRQLSKGNLQRLGLAQALLFEERLIVLDEPTHGLDPVWTQRFRDIVSELRRPDRAIFIASHNLDELQRVADRVGIIDQGQLQRIVETRAVSQADREVPYRLLLASGYEAVRELCPAAREAAPGEVVLPAMSVIALNALLRALFARGALVVSVAPVHSSLEQQFREAVGERIRGAGESS
jgi:ABC-2 type transport system ATP-binding protein